MDDLVKFMDASRGTAGSECGFGEARAVDGLVWIQYSAPEMTDDFVVDRAAGLHEVVGHDVGLDQVGSEFDEHFARG
jgi:hypothetical protein